MERADDVIEAITRAKRKAGNPFDADAYRKQLIEMDDNQRCIVIDQALAMPDIQRHFLQIDRERLSADDRKGATRPEPAAVADTDWNEVFRAERMLRVLEKDYEKKTGKPVNWRELGFD